MSIKIGSIVEGHGEVFAIPVLLRRIALEAAPHIAPEILRPFRNPRSALVKEGGLEKAVETVALSVRPRGAILVLIDSDDDCPREFAPRLHYSRVRERRRLDCR